MIAELNDGRKFGFPDDMPEDQMDRIVQALLAAEAAVAKLQTKYEALAAKSSAATAPSNDTLAKEIQALRTELAVGIKQIVLAVRADRVLVRDETGEPYKSKVV